jgi:hypothetical protein
LSLSEPSGPDLAGIVAAAEAVDLPYVAIGGFAVIVHAYVRATIGAVGEPLEADEAAQASDLRHLEAIHGPLPIDPIPGLDS